MTTQEIIKKKEMAKVIVISVLVGVLVLVVLIIVFFYRKGKGKPSISDQQQVPEKNNVVQNPSNTAGMEWFAMRHSGDDGQRYIVASPFPVL